MIGGIVGQHYGWRNAFIYAGLPGLLLAATLLPFRNRPVAKRREWSPKNPRLRHLETVSSV
jgi:predicted MFS family arabinose efflux permease